MRPWGIFDVALWLGLSFFEVVAQIGAFGAVYYALGIIPHIFINVPWQLFLNYKVRTWDRRSSYSRLASPFEYASAIMAGYILRRFNAKEVGSALFGRFTAETLFDYRKSFLTREGLADVEHYALDPDQNLDGFWVESRKTPVEMENDVVLFYVAGPGIGGESAYWNLEFFYYLLVAMDQQGFLNPAIFVADASQAKDWQDAMTSVIHTYGAVSGIKCKSLVLCGHAGGATLALDLMLHRVSPFGGLPALPDQVRPPDAAILISPILDLKRHRLPSQDEIDYVSHRALKRYYENYAPKRLHGAAYLRPGLIADLDLWQKALPTKGVFVSAGSEEVLLPEIQDFAFHLKGLKAIALEIESGQVHAWPLWLVNTARTRLEATAGVGRLACQISQMCLWDSTLR